MTKIPAANKQFPSLIQRFGPSILLVLMILYFTGTSLFVAFNLQRDIVPDEPYHVEVAIRFARTWGIPKNVTAAKNIGLYMRQSPYLSYWISGRALNLLNLLKPDPSPWQQLVFLRLLNILFSIGTVIFTYLFSKELINNRWWQLLPVFVLTNTLMFVLLSSGVNYDNPANLFSIASLYYLLRVLNGKPFFPNSLGWLVLITTGTLVKETLLPLALAMAVVWIIFIVRNRKKIDLSELKHPRLIGLLVILLILIGANLALYGVNLLRHRSLTSSCAYYYTEEFCDNTAFAQRRRELALSEEPNVFEAFRQGYPEPLRYAFDIWIEAMLMKIFGIMGGARSYYPISISYYHMLLYWMLALGFRYFRKTSFRNYSLVGIFIFYALTLFIKNYDIELAYGFIQVAHQGRYIFPVIGLGYSLFSYLLMKVPHRWLRIPTLVASIALFFYGGPIRFFLYYQTVFAEWFI